MEFPKHPRVPAMLRALPLHCTALLLLASLASGDPVPGDVFREALWRPEGKNMHSRWQRVTGPAATAERAKRFLPNAVNHLVVSDLDKAIRAELQVELLQSHFGTVGQAFRLNGGAWIEIPPSPFIPGKAGAGEGGPHHWLSMRYPAVAVPLPDVRPGSNTLEFTTAPGFGLGERWPQSLVSGAILRVYYDAAAKPHPTGHVELLPAEDTSAIGFDLKFVPDAGSGESVQRVDFIGRYKGFDWRGEAQYQSWHYQFRRGELRRNLATVWRAPWRALWDTSWLPVQTEPVAIAARLMDATGLYHLTPALEVPDAVHPRSSRIELLSPHAVSQRWQTRAKRRHSCKITLPESLAGLREARVILATWNGYGADEIGVNDTVICSNIGLNHDLSYDTLTVPISALHPGENEFFTASNDKEHGIEVQWPGFVLLLRFEERHPPGGTE